MLTAAGLFYLDAADKVTLMPKYSCANDECFQSCFNATDLDVGDNIDATASCAMQTHTIGIKCEGESSDTKIICLGESPAIMEQKSC